MGQPVRVPRLFGGCAPRAHGSSGVSRFHTSWPFALSLGRGELCGFSPPGARQVLPLLVSFLVLPPLLSWSGQDGHLLWSLDVSLAFKCPGSSKNLEKSGPEQMCLWTAVHVLTARDGL